jgi:hypothetical protein
MMARLLTLFVLLVSLAMPAMAQETAADPRASTGGAQTLEDTANNQPTRHTGRRL